MNFFNSLPANTQFILLIGMVASFGLALGSIKYKGIGLGSAGPLFAGLLIANLGFHINHEILEFVKEFGLILFVFTIGIQLGPGILDVWRQQGGILNGLAFLIALAGFGLTIFAAWFLSLNYEAAAGLYSGAVTNTPSLGASQQLLAELASNGHDRTNLITLAYAVAYPGAIVGIILSILLLKSWLKIDLQQEDQQLHARQKYAAPLVRRNLLITNENLDKLRIADIPGRLETGIQISRVWQESEQLVHVATENTIIHVGDIILAVGNAQALDKFQLIVGSESTKDLMKASGDVHFSRVLITNKKILGKTLRELAIDHLWGVTITRIIRAGVEMTASGSTHIQYGDMLHIVGGKEGLENVAKYFGNSPKDLNETQFIPFFLGITFGVIVGLIPISIPGLPVPVRLGLAGGPLIVAILVSLIGNLGPLVWYIPATANRSIREMGIILFLTCVGLHSGDRFFGTVFSMQGLLWLIIGFLITVIPLLIMGLLARKLLNLNFHTLCGLIAGSMTDPPALAFANSLSQSEAASIAYAAVYPLAMTLRILTAQLLIILLFK